MVAIDYEIYRAYRQAVNWKKHHGIDYLHVHFKGMCDEDIVKAVKYMRTEMENKPPQSIRYFFDASESDFSLSTNITLRKVASRMQHLIHKSGFTGISGHKIFLYNAYQSFTKSKSKLFATEKEALDYICS